MNLQIHNSYLLGMRLKLKEEKWFEAEFFMSFFMIFIKSLLYYQVFRMVFLHSDQVDANEITLYYIVINIVTLSIVAAQYVAYHHMQDINSGAIIPYLLRPNSYIVSKYLNSLASVAVRLVVNILLIYGISWFLGQKMSLSAVGLGLLSVLLGFTILYLIQAVIGCFSVWFHDITRFRDIVYSMLLILGGRLIPCELLFSNLKNVIYFTPIPYVYDVPARTLMGRTSWLNLGIQMVWIILFGSMYLYLYERHVRHGIEFGG